MSQPPTPTNKPVSIVNGSNLSSGNLNSNGVVGGGGGRPLPSTPIVNSNNVNTATVGGVSSSPLKSPPILKPRPKTVTTTPTTSTPSTTTTNTTAPQNTSSSNLLSQKTSPPTLPRREWPPNNNSTGNLNNLTNNNNATVVNNNNINRSQSVSEKSIASPSSLIQPPNPPQQIVPLPIQPPPTQQPTQQPSQPIVSTSTTNNEQQPTITTTNAPPVTPIKISLTDSSASITSSTSSTPSTPNSSTTQLPHSTSSSSPINMSPSTSSSNLYSTSAPSNSSLANYKPIAPNIVGTGIAKPEPLTIPAPLLVPPTPISPDNKQKRNSLGEQTSTTLEKMVNESSTTTTTNNEDEDVSNSNGKDGKDGKDSGKGSKSKPKLFPHQWSMGKLASEKEIKREEKERKENEKREEKERKEQEKKEKKERKEREKLENKKGDDKKDKSDKTSGTDKSSDKPNGDKEDKKDKTTSPSSSSISIEKPGLSRTTSSFASKLKHATLRGNKNGDIFEDDSSNSSNSNSVSSSPSLTPQRDSRGGSQSMPHSPIVSSSTSNSINISNLSSSNLGGALESPHNSSSNSSSGTTNGSSSDGLSSSPPNSQSPSLSSATGAQRSAIHLDTSRGLMTWGSASNCKLGFKVTSKDQSQPTPERLPNFNISDICSISSGSYYSAALTENGEVYAWGRGAVKTPPVPILGIPSIEDQLLPIKLESLTDIVVVSIGFYHSAAVRANGELLTWGVGDDGQLGHGDNSHCIEPTVIKSLASMWITQVQCGEKHTICLTKNGKVYAWGSSEYGQLGLGDTSRHSSPMLITALEKYNVLQISAGSTHCAVLTNSKEVLVFGNGAAMGSASIVSLPTLVPSLKYLHIDRLACGHYSTAAISECGDVYTWGTGQELGHGGNSTETTPKLVEALRNQSIRQISCGGRHTAFLTDSGRIFTCGKDSFGQLGQMSGDQNKPKKIESLTKTTFISISCGENYNVSLFDTTRSFRDKFCWKLLETQRTYVRTLDILQTIFLNPLRIRDRDQLPESMKHLPYIFLSEEEIRTIFGPIEKLYALNSTLLHVMNKRFAGWSNKKKVGDVLLNHFKHSEDTFIQYMENLPLALTCLDGLCKKQTAPIVGYLKECEKLALERKKLDTDDDTKEFNLRSLLVEPLNIISRYHKAINGMVKYTKTTHIDYSGLVDLDGIMEIKVNKATNILSIIATPASMASYTTNSSGPTSVTTASAGSSGEDSAFLRDYDIKLEALQNFKKTCTKIIKSSKKYYEVEPDSFKEQGHFSEHLINVKSCFDGNIDPALASSIDQFSSSIKKIGYLRSELSTRTHTSFAQPLSTVADELEAFLPLIIEMRKRAFENHTEYENAVNKLYSLAKNLQPTEKKMIEAEKEVASLKRILDKTLYEFDTIFKEGISIQTKSLKLFYACMKAQQEYYERGLQRFQAMKPSFDALDSYFRQQSRNTWAKSIYDTVTTTFTTEKGIAGQSTPSLSSVRNTATTPHIQSQNTNSTTVVPPANLENATNANSGATPSVVSPINTTVVDSANAASPLSSTPKDGSTFTLSDNVDKIDAASTSTLLQTPSKSPSSASASILNVAAPSAPLLDPHQIMTELEQSDWTFLMDPPAPNEFTETFIEEQYDGLVEILASASLQVVQCVVSAAPSDQQSTTIDSISRVFESFNKIRPIIQSGIEQEVASTANPSTLFRSNTTATKLMTAFTKLKGMPYLSKHITPLVREIIDNPNGYEVDPAKINEGSEELMTNMMNLIQICEKFTDAIIDSVENLPISLREISSYLQQEVVKKFPDNKYSSVGGFIFLRFLCPSILAPHTSGLVEEQPGPEATRALVLIGKVLQNLANGIEFGQKESFMIPVNRFIVGNVNRLNNYFDQLTNVGTSSLHKSFDHGNSASNSRDEVQKDIRNIHLLIVKNLSKLVKQLALYKQKDTIGQLSKTLVFLGDPTSMYK